MGKTLSIIGGVFTTAYLIGLGILVDGRWQELQGMPLNNLGDFLAGAFGPLAIVWLVLGYFQQGIELRQNSQALHLQAQELANSVEQQRELVKVAQDQYKADREAMEHQMRVFAQEQERERRSALPNFVIEGYGGSHSTMSEHSFSLRNIGAPCSSVRMRALDGEITFLPESYMTMTKDGTAKFICKLPRQPEFDEKEVALTFTDMYGNPGGIQFVLRFKDSGLGYFAARLDPAASPS